jgi:hypothetical protein
MLLNVIHSDYYDSLCLLTGIGGTVPGSAKWNRAELLAAAEKARMGAARLRNAALSATDETAKKTLRERVAQLDKLAEMLETQAAKLPP